MSSSENTEVNWVIDRNPGYSILIDNYNDNIIFDFINTINIINNLNDVNRTNNITFNNVDEYIPFNLHRPVPTIIISQFHTSEETIDCSICMETCNSSEFCELNCNHQFCSDCIIKYIDKKVCFINCPLCRTLTTKILVKTELLHEKFCCVLSKSHGA